MTFIAKLIAVLVLYLTALCLPDSVIPALTGWLATVWEKVGRQRTVAILLVYFLAFGGSALVSLSGHLPQPGTHDEFSYLLAADTFLHGRLSNETHPLWPHFESIHILQQPTYMSKYPPGQGLALALGRLIGGQAIVGVWLSLALACGAICWMLQAWVTEPWAFLGGVLAALSLAPGPWGQSYWGGAVAALGGALVYGALRRIVRRPRWRHGIILGVGLAVLANSRPYEGLVASLPAAGVVVAWAWQRRHGPERSKIAIVLLCILFVVGLNGVWMAWYNYRVTGNPLCTPYQAHDNAYAAAPLFLWQKPLERVPEYHHAVMREYFVDWEQGHYLRKRAFFGLNSSGLTKIWIFLKFFIGPLLAVPMVLVAKYSQDWWLGLAALTSGLVLIALSQTLYLHPHYAAPVTGLVLVLAVQGLRFLWDLDWRCKPLGRLLVLGTVGLHVLAMVWPAVVNYEWGEAFRNSRAQVAAQLAGREGLQLVVVRYGPAHNCHDEWVYNEADIDGSQVVWAREMKDNRQLLDYFKERRAWLLVVDDKVGELQPYRERDR